MKKTFKQIRWPVAFLMILMGGLAAQANAAGMIMKMSGSIDRYDRKAAILVVDDMSFHMGLDTVVMNKTGKSTTSFQLTPKRRITFEFEPLPTGAADIAGKIKNIWLQ